MKKYVIILSLFLLMLSGCRSFPILYQPNIPMMPMPDGPKELHVEANAGLDGYGGKISYSIDSHLVIFANGSLIYDNKLIDRSLADIGIGYYQKLGNYGHFEVLGSGGYGFTNDATTNHLTSGLFTRHFTSKTEFLSIFSSMKRGSIQADLGIGNENLKFGIGARLTGLYFDGDYQASYFNASGHKDSVKTMSLRRNAWMIEPCITVLAGLKHVKLFWEFGFSTLAGGLPPYPNYGPLYSPIILEMGLQVSISCKPKNKK